MTPAADSGPRRLVRGRLVTADAVIPDGYVECAGDRIVAVGPVAEHPDRDALPAAAGTVLPGLVDLHCHGGGGAAVTSGEPEQVRQTVCHHRAAGTTSLMLSAVTDAPDRMLGVVSAAADAVDEGDGVAIHLEGPFLSPGRCGAQDPAHLRTPDPALVGELLAAGRGHVRVMTVAPELPAADALLDQLAEHRVVAAVGHTSADAPTTARALARPGVDLVTHLFNGMPPMHHRAPGPVAAALEAAARGRARLELVADGVHLADDTVSLVFTLLAADRLVLVTDAMAAAGMPDGDYRLGPQQVSVRHGVARLHGDGEASLAGGTSRLLEVVRRCVHEAGVDLVSAVTAASATPAAVLGRTAEIGALRPGARADLLLVDDELVLQRVMHGGSWLS